MMDVSVFLTNLRGSQYKFSFPKRRKLIQTIIALAISLEAQQFLHNISLLSMCQVINGR